ncbi:cytosolic sulfotransferase 10-like [Panicum virgatum]|uniref:Sulfotransferase n=1 Tax=Panicum virgatum TaxID=38727 RepID=A0A8T0T975_PANVG|nr:cytosolic sulfotransferase 10-like [Panicum virgatum]KAG2604986.1 hypothetical protein PVAP13_4NG123400 [Panicum virgatum]
MAAPADTGAATAAASTLVPPRLATPHGDLAEILPSLPLETRCLPSFHLRCYKGFWLSEKALTGYFPAIHAHFEPRPDDIFLTSFPKSGTTLLKALAFATLNRAAHPPSDADHPLRRRNPHSCVRFLGASGADDTEDEPAAALRSPLVLATHLPYSLLPDRIRGGRGEGSGIVYICRNPKDVLVSGWLFTKKTSAMFGLDVQSYTLQEAFDLFCEGRCINGPHWQHALEYWEESFRRPGKVLFLRYEEMLREPASSLRKLAEFMGCAFSEEEDGGLVDAIVELCSLGELKSMDVNKNGSNHLAVKNETYFRMGVIGDWSNHLTPEMAEKLDKIVGDALQGSGLDLSSYRHQLFLTR